MERKESNIRFSIIIPVYNGTNYIRRCWESWDNQTKKDFEIIFIDDGSIDDSYSILEDIEDSVKNGDKGYNVTVIGSDHQGVSHCRNLGIAAAKGAYIGFCDIDDVVHSRLIEFVTEVIDDTLADIVYFYCKPIQNEHIGDFLHSERKLNLTELRNISVREFQTLVTFSYRVMGSVWNKFFRRDVVINHLFREDLQLCEDMHFVYTVICGNENLSICEMPVELYGYVNNKNSSTTALTNLLDDHGRIKYCVSFDAIIRDCNDSRITRIFVAQEFGIIENYMIHLLLMYGLSFKKTDSYKGLRQEQKQCYTTFLKCPYFKRRHKIKMVLLYFLRI